VKDVAKHDTNEINLKERLHATKCDKKDDPQVRDTEWCEMCSVKSYPRIDKLQEETVSNFPLHLIK